MTRGFPERDIYMSKKINDDDYLIYSLKCGNNEAFNILSQRYMRLSKIIAADFFYNNYLPGMTLDDVAAIYIANIFIALNHYDPKAGSFKAFWKQISYHEVIKTIEENAKYHRPGNISLNQTIDGDGESTVEDIIGMCDPDVSISLAMDDIVYEVQENETSCLTQEEKEIFIDRTIGLTYQEIASKRNAEIKHVRYIYSRALAKLSETTHFK